MSRLDELLSAINSFQAACNGEEDLVFAMQRLNEAFSADGLALETRLRPSIEAKELQTVGIDPDSLKGYSDYYAHINPRASVGIERHHPAISHDGLIGPNDEFERTEFYTDYLRRLKIRYFLSLRVDPNPHTYTVLAFQFEQQRGPVDQDDIRLAETALPLLSRGMARRWERIYGANVGWVKADMIRRLRLTPSEADLAIDLIRGFSVVRHADARQVTKNTAYTHFARLKDKLDCRQHGELLVRLCVLYPEFAQSLH